MIKSQFSIENFKFRSKKHDKIFEVLISDLKSARKNILENTLTQTNYFRKVNQSRI